MSKGVIFTGKSFMSLNGKHLYGFALKKISKYKKNYLNGVVLSNL